MKRKWCLLFGLILAVMFAACDLDESNGPETPPLTAFLWRTATPQSQSLDADLLQDALDAAEQHPFFLALLVVRNDRLVAEGYFNDHERNETTAIYSATKSIVSTLMGMAIEKGYVDSIDVKLMDIFPEYRSIGLDPQKEEITIQHLLTMQSGFESEDIIGPEMSYATNMVNSIIASDLRFAPGEGFLYSTHGSHLLSAIITKALDMTAYNFAMEVLFEPLGIQLVGWQTDQNGIFFGGGGMYLTPRDMARFGQVFLKNGVIDGHVFVTPEWVNASVTNYRDYTTSWNGLEDIGYGYQWWTGRFGTRQVYFALGYGGQWILIIPELDMIVVAAMNGATDDSQGQSEAFIDIMIQYILPSVIS